MKGGSFGEYKNSAWNCSMDKIYKRQGFVEVENMTKYKLSKQELQDHWDDQIRFIQKSIKEFDRGDEKEAQRLATHLRVLFHETQKSKSIFGQLKPQIIFYSSGDLYTPSNLFTSWTLLDLMVSPEGIKYNAKSNNQSRCFF